MPIFREEILKGQVCPASLEDNLQHLLQALNEFRLSYGREMIVTSGYRTEEHNAAIGGAAHSAHRECLAADFEDFPPHPIRTFALMHEDLLISSGLYMEAPTSDEDNHVHLTIRPPASGSRIFIA